MLREENAALRSEVEEDREMISQLEEMTDQLRRQRIVHQASVLVGVLVSLWVCFCLAVYLSARVCLSACLHVFIFIHSCLFFFSKLSQCLCASRIQTVIITLCPNFFWGGQLAILEGYKKTLLLQKP